VTRGTHKGWLTTSDVAELLSCDAKTVARWAQQGLVGHVVTLGGHHRFRPADLEPIYGGVPAGERLLTASSAAQLLGVSHRSVIGYIAGGKLPSVRLPGTERFRRHRIPWAAVRDAAARMGHAWAQQPPGNGAAP
jgi:excisionase family DNA binding protein